MLLLRVYHVGDVHTFRWQMDLRNVIHPVRFGIMMCPVRLPLCALKAAIQSAVPLRTRTVTQGRGLQTTPRSCAAAGSRRNKEKPHYECPIRNGFHSFIHVLLACFLFTYLTSSRTATLKSLIQLFSSISLISQTVLGIFRTFVS